MQIANRLFTVNQHAKTDIRAIPSADELRAMLSESENAEIRKQIFALLDENTFIETGAFTKKGFSEFLSTDKSDVLESVITGYGAMGGKLVFVFAEDVSRNGGVIDERHAAKIENLYRMAIKGGAPVIGIFNSKGTDIFGGAASLSAYAKMMKAVSDASGIIPQIAFIPGNCLGCAATIAAMFDFIVKVDKANLYVTSPDLNGNLKTVSNLSFSDNEDKCYGFIHNLIDFLPSNAAEGKQIQNSGDSLNRSLGDIRYEGDALNLVSSMVDNGLYLSIGENEQSNMLTAFSTIGGVATGIIANDYKKNDGKISNLDAKKASSFISFCDAFSIPVITLVDSDGVASDASAEALSELAFAYASSDNAKVTVITGHAYGAAFVLLGSKAIGADVVYAMDNAEIGALNPEAGVAFAWDKYVSDEQTRDNLIEEWKQNITSAVAAASTGEVDDIISVNELRARVCSALLMLTANESSIGGRL